MMGYDKMVDAMKLPKEEVFSLAIDLLKVLKEDVLTDDKNNKKSIDEKDSAILKLSSECDKYRAIIKSKQEFLNSITPTKVFHNKERGNTTVKFFDGSSITVKKMKGDKDCLETAIVWAIFKKLYPSGLMRHLVKNTIETGGK